MTVGDAQLAPKYQGTNTGALLDVIRQRLAATGGPQGIYQPRTAAQKDAAARYTGYPGATEQKDAISGLAGYEKAQEDAIAQIMADSAAAYAHDAQAEVKPATDQMHSAYDKASQYDNTLGNLEGARQGSAYAGKAAEEWARSHPEPTSQPPTSSVPAIPASGQQPQTMRQVGPSGPPRTMPGAPNAGPDLMAASRDAEAQQAAAAQDVPLRQQALYALDQAYNKVGEVGPVAKDARNASDADTFASEQQKYASLTPYQQKAAIEMGVDPLQAAGMYYDSPADQLTNFTRSRDLTSIDTSGMTYSEAKAAQRDAEAQQTSDQKAQQDAIDKLITQSTGLTANQADFRTGLSTPELAGVVQSPDFAKQVAAQDEMINGVLSGDTDAARHLVDFLRASDIDPGTQRLLRARMNNMGVSDSELVTLAGG